MFLNYDILAKRWVPYSYIYPFAEGLAGILMIAGALNWLSIPVALFSEGRQQRIFRIYFTHSKLNDDWNGFIHVDYAIQLIYSLIRSIYENFIYFFIIGFTF